MDYTFREFEEDITSAVENDKKRFKAEEVNGEEKELLYSKPAYETGRLLGTGRQNTRRSRRLMDLDYESDSESKTSGYECEGNSDEEAQLTSTWHGTLRRQRRVIDDDDDDVDDGNNNANNASTEEPKVSETERDELLKEDEEVNGEDKDPSESVKSEEKIVNEEQTAKKPDDQESTKEDDDKDDKVTSSGSVAQVGVAAVFTTSQSQSTALSGNKIHPHSRIASVAPVARNQPTTDANNFRSTPSYPPEGVFPNPPNFNILKPQFPAKQAPNYLANMAATNISGNSNFGASANLAPSGVSGMLQGGSSFSGAEAVGFANTRTNFGGPGVSPPVQGGTNFPSPNLTFQNANVGGQSISGSNFGGVNNLT